MKVYPERLNKYRWVLKLNMQAVALTALQNRREANSRYLPLPNLI
jgi:hypothetical protein